MSETKLKTVGDCVNLCKSAGIEISHLDDNLFETAGAIDGLLCKIAQLEKEKYESIDAWNSQLEKLTTENAELKKAKLNQYVRVGYTNYYQLHYMTPNEFSQDAFQNDDDSGNVFQTQEDGDFEVYVSTATWNKYQEQLQEQE